MSFGKQIRALRKHLNMTQEVFAIKVGCSSRTVIKWETEVHKPSPKYVNRLLTIASKYDYEQSSKSQ